MRAAALEPVVRAAIEQDDVAWASRTHPALTMSRSPTFTGRTDPGRTEQSAEGFAAEREAFLLGEPLPEVVVVEAGLGGAGQAQEALAHRPRETAVAGPGATGVSQRPAPPCR